VLKGPDSKDAKAYVVQTGDTMFAIAKRFSVSAAALAEENDLSAGSSIRKGQKLRLPDGYKDKGPTRTTVMQAVAQTPATSARSPLQPPIGSTPNRGPTQAAAPAPSRAVEDEPEAPVARPVTTTTTSVTGRWSRSPVRAAPTPSSRATRSTPSPGAWTPPAPTWPRTTTSKRRTASSPARS
jgi:LysM repeat protein